MWCCGDTVVGLCGAVGTQQRQRRYAVPWGRGGGAVGTWWLGYAVPWGRGGWVTRCRGDTAAGLCGRARPSLLGSPFLQQPQMLSVRFEFSHFIHFRD